MVESPVFIILTPGGIRTPDLLVRSQTLYPAELRALIYFLLFNNNQNILFFQVKIFISFKTGIIIKKFIITLFIIMIWRFIYEAYKKRIRSL